MELTFTLFIKFALITPILIAAFFICLRIINFIFKFDFFANANPFQQFYSYTCFLFSKRTCGFVNEEHFWI